MNLNTARFGEIEYTDEDVVFMNEGLIGFHFAQHFLIIQHREGSAFRWFQSIEEPSLAFPIVDPQAFIANYSPVMSINVASYLRLEENTPRLVYTIATIPSGKPEETTINLMGPIIINAITRKAKQIVLEDEAYSIRWKIFEKDNINKKRSVA